MSRVEAVATITISLLALSFWVGSGAEEYVDWDSGDNTVDTEFEQREIDFSRLNEEDFRYTYIDEEDGEIKPNRTEFENQETYAPFTDIPLARFDPGIEGVESYVVEVDYEEGVPDSEPGSMEYAQGLEFTRLDNGTNIVPNTFDNGEFRISYPVEDSDDPLWNSSIVSIRTTNEAAERQGFLDNFSGLASVSSGYPFVEQVIIATILLLVTYIGLRLIPTVS